MDFTIILLSGKVLKGSYHLESNGSFVLFHLGLAGINTVKGRKGRSCTKSLLSVQATEKVLYFQSMLVVLSDAAQKSKKVRLRTAEKL